MLDYLDGLCAALLARNGTEIRRLLRHPLARALPRRVREEGYSIARAGPESLRAPVQTLHFLRAVKVPELRWLARSQARLKVIGAGGAVGQQHSALVEQFGKCGTHDADDTMELRVAHRDPLPVRALQFSR